MAHNFNTNTKNDPQWLTPPALLKALGPFDLDPCAPINRPWPMARNHYTILDDGLNQPWEGRVWLNPPYGKEVFIWLEKMATHQGGGIALIFARTETIGFHKTVWAKAHSVYFLRGRLSFCFVTGEKAGPANAPSCLVSYSEADTAKLASLEISGFPGKLIKVMG